MRCRPSCCRTFYQKIAYPGNTLWRDLILSVQSFGPTLSWTRNVKIIWHMPSLSAPLDVNLTAKLPMVIKVERSCTTYCGRECPYWFSQYHILRQQSNHQISYFGDLLHLKSLRPVNVCVWFPVPVKRNTQRDALHSRRDLESQPQVSYGRTTETS